MSQKPPTQATTRNNPLGSDGGPTPPSQQPQDRYESVDSAAFFEGDAYDDYDDFGASGGGGGGGGGSKTNKRREERGGGSNNVYSAKHVRAKEAQQKATTNNTKKGPTTK